MFGRVYVWNCICYEQVLARNRPKQYSRFTGVLSDLSQSIRLVCCICYVYMYVFSNKQLTLAKYILVHFSIISLNSVYLTILHHSIDDFFSRVVCAVWHKTFPSIRPNID